MIKEIVKLFVMLSFIAAIYIIPLSLLSMLISGIWLKLFAFQIFASIFVFSSIYVLAVAFYVKGRG